MEQSYKTVSVRMSQELYTALKDLADRDCRSVPSYIRKLLREHIRRLPGEDCPILPAGPPMTAMGGPALFN